MPFETEPEVAPAQPAKPQTSTDVHEKNLFEHVQASCRSLVGSFSYGLCGFQGFFSIYLPAARSCFFQSLCVFFKVCVDGFLSSECSNDQTSGNAKMKLCTAETPSHVQHGHCHTLLSTLETGFAVRASSPKERQPSTVTAVFVMQPMDLFLLIEICDCGLLRLKACEAALLKKKHPCLFEAVFLKQNHGFASGVSFF